MKEKNNEIKDNYEKKVIYSFLGLEYQKPTSYEEWLVAGIIFIFIILTIPVWGPLYLLVKLIMAISKKKRVVFVKMYSCPDCNSKIKRQYETLKLKCDTCNWHGYLDDLDGFNCEYSKKIPKQTKK